jgi:aspartate aminotransferase-like enzyme
MKGGLPMYKLMTAGPTQVPDDVLLARSRVFPNPDQDPEFVEFYHDTCRKLSELLGSSAHETLILGGEGILALEAACATLTEPGDRILVLDNGLFGAGFSDFVRLYGGNPTLYTADYRRELDPIALRSFLEKDHDFKYATLVHCDTPSGILNDIAVLCPLLKEFGILTVVDSVAAMFGEPVDIKNGIDVLCGGSQKVLSAPPGLAFVTISPDAWQVMKKRSTPVASFYANLLTFATYYEDQWFPYTMPASDLYGLSAALEHITADPQMVLRHRKIAAACRSALRAGGVNLYPESGFANTVTAFCVPEGLTSRAILDGMLQNHGIMLSNSFGPFAGKVLRIGHMGANCNRKDMEETMDALNSVLNELGLSLHCHLGEAFRLLLD